MLKYVGTSSGQYMYGVVPFKQCKHIMFLLHILGEPSRTYAGWSSLQWPVKAEVPSHKPMSLHSHHVLTACIWKGLL